MRLLLEAGVVLAESLELEQTLGQVARLTVPHLADLCVIDLRDEDGVIRRMAVASAEARVARELEAVGERGQLDPNGEHPVARVIRSGEAELLVDMTNTQMRSFAEGSRHARFMIEHGYHSAAVAPLLARQRTLGALSVLRLTGGASYTTADMDLVGELARRAALAIDNARLFSEVRRAELAESFMAEASRMLASSSDYVETLGRVAQLAAPSIADWCAIDVLSEDGTIERVALHHSDPRKLALVERLERSEQRPLADAEGVVAAAIRSGRPRLIERITPELLSASIHDHERLELLQAIGPTSAIVVPLAAPTRTVGAITLASAESRRRLSRVDVALAERLGRRAGTAVESARLYTERTRIANTLQAALLPQSLPAIAGVQTEALYRAAGELNDVGGDFYDVFQYGSEGADGWLVAIGDVCGKGPQAAGVTALARHTLRTAAMLGQTPAGMLATLHRSLKAQPAGADMCTVCLVTVERLPDSARLTVTLAGHPQPVHVDSTGSTTLLGKPGTLLGVLDPIETSEVHAELRAGETLLLYTDGLSEAGRAGRQLGEEGVLELCAEGARLSLSGMLERIEQVALEHADGWLRDDIALLALRLCV